MYIEKERELGASQREIKALKMSEVLKDKAVAEVMKFVDIFVLSFDFFLLSDLLLFQMSNELKKMEEKLSITEKHLEFKVVFSDFKS